MISVFVCDIDGCLAEPYEPYQLEPLAELTRLGQRAGTREEPTEWPLLSICSGRAYPYVEAISQMLDARVPVLFESGGGMFDPVAASITWNPELTPEIEEALAEVFAWFRADLVPGTSMMVDHAKRSQVGVIGPDQEEVAALVPQVEREVARRWPKLRVFNTPVSIDVLPPAITKKQGMNWLAELLDIPIDQIAYIGDSNGDIEAIQTVGYGFAPANAAEPVRRSADHVTRGRVAEGVLEAYTWCVEQNKKALTAV